MCTDVHQNGVGTGNRLLPHTNCGPVVPRWDVPPSPLYHGGGGCGHLTALMRDLD